MCQGFGCFTQIFVSFCFDQINHYQHKGLTCIQLVLKDVFSKVFTAIMT